VVKLPFIVESKEFEQKARLVMSLLTRITHSNEKFIKLIIAKLYENYDKKSTLLF
jgi:hypothetical protein